MSRSLCVPALRWAPPSLSASLSLCVVGLAVVCAHWAVVVSADVSSPSPGVCSADPNAFSCGVQPSSSPSPSPLITNVLANVAIVTVCTALVAVVSIISILIVVASRWAGIATVDAKPLTHAAPSVVAANDQTHADFTPVSFIAPEHESPYQIFAPVKLPPTKAFVLSILKVVLPLCLKGINGTGRFGEKYAPWFRPSEWILPANVESILRIASWWTGLSDFGDDNFLEGLNHCVHDVNNHGNLSPFGRIAIWLDVQRMLQGRLQLVDHRKRFPEIEQERIRAPVVILGMPRTGTTLLYNLLSLDYERFRSPRAWECHHIYPPPRAETYRSDPRIKLVEDSLEVLHAVLPDLHSIHPMYAEGPQETFELMCYDFTSFVIPFTHLNAPTYLDWFMKADISPTYEFLKWQLKYLQWQGPKSPQWLLKSPEHIFSLRSMLKVFPDARIICTHRDPVRVISSAHSLMRCFRTLTSDSVDNRTIAPLWAPHLARALDDMIELRESATGAADRSGDDGEGLDSGDESGDDCSSNSSRSSSSPRRELGRSSSIGSGSSLSSASDKAEKEVWDASQAVDVRFSDFVRDPVAEIKRIYAQFGDELSATAERRMRQYLAEDKLVRKAHKHVYNWDDTCLDKDFERKRFDRYVTYFNVPKEV